MKHSCLTSAAAAAFALACCAGSAMSQTVFTQWTFEGATPLSPSTNTIVGNNPTLAYFGGTTFPSSGQFPVGVSGSALSSTGYPLQTFGSGTAGFIFTSATSGYDAVQVTLFPRGSNSFSRFVSFDYSTDGGVSFSPVQTLTITSGFPGTPVVIDLAGVPAAQNNPNFQFRLVSVFAADMFTANNVAYLANSAYQPIGTGAAQAYGGGSTPTSSTFRIDNVTIQGNPQISLPPTGTGRGGPVCRGQSVVVSVTTASGANPPSSTISVAANLSAIGGSATETLVDDGTNGDQFAFDGIYSFAQLVPVGNATGAQAVTFTVTDDQARSSNGSFNVGVGDCAVDSGRPVVISKVYGGGGTGTALYKTDFVELFNRSPDPVALTGLSVQYAAASSATGFTDLNGVALLSGVINPGQSILVAMGPAGTAGLNLPRPDFSAPTGFSGMAQTAGRVALVMSITPIGADCSDAAIVDLVGYGTTAFCFEGAGPVGNLAGDMGAIRKSGGTQDNNQNFDDFEIGITIPQNSGNSVPPSVTNPTASPVAVCPSAAVLLTVAVSGGFNPNSTVTGVTGNLVNIGGPATAQFFDDGTNGDLVGFDGIYSLSATVAAGTTAGTKSLVVSATDDQARVGTGTITVGVGSCVNASSTVVISQVYGGGGNSNAPLNADFVEILNRSGLDVSLVGYSVQYSSGTGSQAFGAAGGLVELSGCVGPGEFRLVRMSPVGLTGVAIPTEDFAVGATFLGMSATSGRVALANIATALAGGCGDPAIVDLVGYGTATCFEGSGGAGTTSNVLGVSRKTGGTADTNENFNDFVVGAPAPRNAATVVNPCAPTGCAPDFNGDGNLDPDDLADYIGAYFSEPAPLSADFNRDGTVDPDDLADYIGAYFAGCP